MENTYCQKNGHSYFQSEKLLYCNRCAHIVSLKDLTAKEASIEKTISELEQQVQILKESQKNNVLEKAEKLIEFITQINLEKK